MRIASGIDRLRGARALVSRLRGARVAVLAHAASVDQRFVHLSAVLAELGVAPRRLFAPEHGFAGAAQDMVPVADGAATAGAPERVSLYGDTLADLVPRPHHLADIDVLVVDLVDVGARYYTFVWTALLAVRAAAAAGVHSVLLDRPNPLSGEAASVEGRAQADGFTSFVGWEKVPIRHALTLGELVSLFAGDDGLPLGPDGAVSVLPASGWDRAELGRAWGWPEVQPSPNMPTFDTALVYPGGCLLEGTNLSEGRGHTRPFEVVGAPWLDGEGLARELARLGLPGFVARPLAFIPTFHKHAGRECQGVQIHPTDARRFRPVAVYLALVALAREQAPEPFRFRTERYELVDDVPAFDLLTGSAKCREAMLAGVAPREIAEQGALVEPGWSERMALAAERLTRAAWRP